MHTLFVLSGYKGCGKSVVANALYKVMHQSNSHHLLAEGMAVLPSPNYQQRLERGAWAFATPIKLATWAMLAAEHPEADPDTLDWLVYGDGKEQPNYLLGASSRRIQQLIGTEMGRDHLSPTVWADSLLNRMDHQLAHHARGNSGQPTVAVVDDMRFTNEHELVMARKGEWNVHHIHVNRPELGCADTHRSEQQVEQLHAMADEVLHNVSDLRALVQLATDAITRRVLEPA